MNYEYYQVAKLDYKTNRETTLKHILIIPIDKYIKRWLLYKQILI